MYMYRVWEPGKAFKNVGGEAPHIFEGPQAPHIFEGLPGPPGPARPQKRSQKRSGQTAFRYPVWTVFQPS